MLEAKELKKSFGSIEAVKGISFRVERGEILGFMGPNGAGKSTTMRMITGFLPPTSGTATVCGHDVRDNPVAAKKCIGYLPENAPVYADMTVSGFLGFVSTDGRLVQFGTWSGARITRLEVDGPGVGVTVHAGRLTIEIHGTRTHTGMLAAPVAGAMDRRIAESLDSTLHVVVTDRTHGTTAFDGGSAGIEVVGDVRSLRPRS